MTVRGPSRSAVAAVVVVSAVVAGLAPVGADVSGVPSDPTARLDASTVVGRDVPRFVHPPYSEHSGDVVRVPVAVPFGGSAGLSIRGNGSGYAATVTLHDGNGDGLVTLVWNTYLAGSGAANRSLGAAAAGDDVANRSVPSVDGPVPAGGYRLAAGRGTNGTVTDTTTLRLRRPGPVGLTVLRADPDVAAGLTDPGDVAAANETTDLAVAYAAESRLADERPVPVVARGEAVVLALRAPGLAGALAVADGPNASAGFRALLGDGVAVRLREHEGTVEESEDGFAYDLRNASGVRVVADPGSDTYHLVLGTPEAVLHAGPDAVVTGVEAGDVFRVAATVRTARQSAARAETAALVAQNDIASFDHGRAARLALPAGNATVGGPTTLRPGEQVTVRVESPAGDPFPLERTVRVGSDGRFEAAFDLSAVPPGTRFEAVVGHDGRTTDSVAGVVGPIARVRFEDRRVEFLHLASRVQVDSVYANRGGFVAVHRESREGALVGVSEYLPPGNHTGVTPSLREPLDGNVTLVAVVHRDADGDREFDPGSDPVYPAGAPTSVAQVVDVGGTPTPSPTVTPTVTRTPTGTPSGDRGVPGFGPGVAVVALAVGLALRRARRSRHGG